MLRKTVIVVLVLLNIGCDQLAKNVVRKNVDSKDYIEVIENHFILTNVENTGAMLGFGQDLPPLLKIFFLQFLPVVVLVILLMRILWKSHLNSWLIVAFAFVIGGGIGNLIDRIAYGSVTDFFQIKMGIFRTGIFNMADVSVTIGILLLLFFSVSKQKWSI